MQGAVQLDLFDDLLAAPEPSKRTGPPTIKKPLPLLNGMFYDPRTDRLVSYVQGRKHWEGPLTGDGYLVEYQKRVKTERAFR